MKFAAILSKVFFMGLPAAAGSSDRHEETFSTFPTQRVFSDFCFFYASTFIGLRFIKPRDLYHCSSSAPGVSPPFGFLVGLEIRYGWNIAFPVRW